MCMNKWNVPYDLYTYMEYLIICRHVQVDEVLSTDSAEEIADDKTPGPMTEINFWEAKCINLESLFEQVFRPRYS